MRWRRALTAGLRPEARLRRGQLVRTLRHASCVRTLRASATRLCSARVTQPHLSSSSLTRAISNEEPMCVLSKEKYF